MIGGWIVITPESLCFCCLTTGDELWWWVTYHDIVVGQVIPWKPTKITENEWKSMKTNENQWKSMKINENQWKSMEINENQWKLINFWFLRGRGCSSLDLPATRMTCHHHRMPLPVVKRANYRIPRGHWGITNQPSVRKL